MEKLQAAFDEALQIAISQAVAQGTSWKLPDCTRAHNKNLIAMSKCDEVHTWGYILHIRKVWPKQVSIQGEIWLELHHTPGKKPIHARVFTTYELLPRVLP